MDAASTAALLSATGSIIQAIVWPAVILFVLIWFRKPFRVFLENLGEFRFKAGPAGLEASAVRRQVEAAASLGAAVARRAGERPGPDAGFADDLGERVSRLVRTAGDPEHALVLWVDDHPANNLYERQALGALGIEFDLSTSTEDALQRLRQNRYDLIISDMGRPPDNRAGYTLLDRVRQDFGLDTPFLIYAGSSRVEYDAEAKQRGASGSTGSPGDLFRLVTDLLARPTGHSRGSRRAGG